MFESANNNWALTEGVESFEIVKFNIKRSFWTEKIRRFLCYVLICFQEFFYHSRGEKVNTVYMFQPKLLSNEIESNPSDFNKNIVTVYIPERTMQITFEINSEL